MRTWLCYSCPACGDDGQHVSVIGSLFRVTRGACRNCGRRIESGLGDGAYLLLVAYTHIVGLVAGVIVIAGLLTERWGLAAAAVAVFAMLACPVGMATHARRATIRCIG